MINNSSKWPTRHKFWRKKIVIVVEMVRAPKVNQKLNENEQVSKRSFNV